MYIIYDGVIVLLCSTLSTELSILSERVRLLNMQTCFAVDEDVWPPNQQKKFIPLLLAHYECQHTGKPKATLRSIQPDRLYSKCVCTREVLYFNSLAQLQVNDDVQFILIEELPGVGKSLLLQYKWTANMLIVHKVDDYSWQLNQVKKFTPLILIHHERHYQALVITELAQAGDIASQNYQNGGEGIVFLLDGFDEFPVEMQEHFWNSKVCECHVLSNLVMSSHPYALENIYKKATHRVDILGFTETDLIKQALPTIVEVLSKYFEGNLIIDDLCFNMICLCKKRIAYSTQLYDYFICLTEKLMTISFVSFSTQEFLGAWLLPAEEQLTLEEKFWIGVHSNKFAIYTLFTNEFQQFHAGGEVLETFLKDQLQCFHLFCSSYKTKDGISYHFLNCGPSNGLSRYQNQHSVTHSLDQNSHSGNQIKCSDDTNEAIQSHYDNHSQSSDHQDNVKESMVCI